MHSQGKLLRATAITAAVVWGAVPAGAAVIDFEDLQRGEIVDDQYEDPHGVTISAVNGEGGPDEGIVFRAVDYDPSTENEGPSGDLRPPFDGGNLAGSVDPNKVLVIARNTTDDNDNGLVDFPEAARIGSIQFQFEREQRSFGFDVIDVDDPGLFSIEFSRLGGTPVVLSFEEFEDENSPYYDDTFGPVEFGNNTINRIGALTSDELGTTFDRVVINIGDRAAFDETSFVAVPEPGTAALAVLGLGGFHLATGRSRRRRRRA